MLEIADQVTVNSAAILLTVRGCDASSWDPSPGGLSGGNNASITRNMIATANAFVKTLRHAAESAATRPAAVAAAG
jgi:hypothetical protein